MRHSEKLEWMKQVVRWYARADLAVKNAGGIPSYVLSDIPDDTMFTLISNNIFLEYKEPDV